MTTKMTVTFLVRGKEGWIRLEFGGQPEMGLPCQALFVSHQNPHFRNVHTPPPKMPHWRSHVCDFKRDHWDLQDGICAGINTLIFQLGSAASNNQGRKLRKFSSASLWRFEMVNYLREEKEKSFMSLLFFSSYRVERLLITEARRSFFFFQYSFLSSYSSFKLSKTD